MTPLMISTCFLAHLAISEARCSSSGNTADTCSTGMDPPPPLEADTSALLQLQKNVVTNHAIPDDAPAMLAAEVQQEPNYAKTITSAYCNDPYNLRKGTSLSAMQSLCDADPQCSGVVDWWCNDDGDYSLCPLPTLETVPDPHKTCIYSKSKDTYRKTHASEHCANPSKPVKQTTLSAMKKLCSDDPQCSGVVDWWCNDDGDYSLCPLPALKTTPEQKHGTCIYEKAYAKKTTSEYCNDPYQLVKGTTLSAMQKLCSADPQCGGVTDWWCNNDGDYSLCPLPTLETVPDPHKSCIYSKSKATYKKTQTSEHCANPSKPFKQTTLSAMKVLCSDDPQCSGVVDWWCNDDGDYSLCPLPALKTTPEQKHGTCIYHKR